MLVLMIYADEVIHNVIFTDLEEAALPLEEYASLRDFFVRSLKEGCRPIDTDPRCLVTGNKNVVTFFYAAFLS